MYPAVMRDRASRSSIEIVDPTPWPARRWTVREKSPAYESEGSEHRTLGSVSVTDDARWTASLTVPIPERNVAFVMLERRGPLPDGYRGSEEAAHLSLPLGEVDALIGLLAGLVDQARHDGVLPPRRDARPG